MRKNVSRPKFLDLTRIKMPVGAVVSIAHRISGILLVLLIPLMIYTLDLSLASESGFEQVTTLFDSTIIRLVAWIGLWAIIHHVLAGIRFLLLDAEIGIELQAARRSALVVNIISAIVLVLSFGWLFL